MFYFVNLKRQIPILILLSLIANTFSGCAGFQQHQQQQRQITSQLLADMETLQSRLDEQKQSLIRVEEGIGSLQKSVAVVDKKTTSAIKTTISEAKKIKAVKAKEAKSNKVKSIDNVPPITPKLYDKEMIGEEEWVYLPVVNEHFKARIDSGAATSSISAKNLEQFERDGKKWVRFDLEHKDQNSSVTLERPIERRVAIRQSISDEKESRPVISLMIKMGEFSESTEFTLADRGQMFYPILLGRSFLRDIVLIDVSKQFMLPQYAPADKAAHAEAPIPQTGTKTD